MSTLREPSLGPIVGHVTHESCRLWIRGAGTHDKKSDLADGARTVGLVSIVAVGGKPVQDGDREVYYFRLHREFDRTGTFNLGRDKWFKRSRDGRKVTLSAAAKLEPDTEYRVRVASLIVDDAADNDEVVTSSDLALRLPDPKVWIEALDRLDPKRSEASFVTNPDPDGGGGDLRFLLGSCRYPGLAWKRKHADAIFGPMVEEYSPGRGGLAPRFNLMVGDQIYADMLNRFVPIGLADTYEEFQDRYMDAFGSKNMARLLRETPTYMILDDHEIEDNWTQDRLNEKRSKRVLFQLAIGAYASYQWSHGPRSFGKLFYYHFECDGYPFFVLDGRTQRFKSGDPDELDDNHMLGRPSFRGDDPSQLERLCKWLVDLQRSDYGDGPKFIVSASVFVPNTIDSIKSDKQKACSDSWPAFPESRRTLLKAIVDHNVQNVVFLSGDIHCSNVGMLEFKGTPEAEQLRAYSVTSSAFYWPFSFADGEPSHFVHDSSSHRTPDTFEIDDGVTMDYKAWHFNQEDNYCQVTVRPDSHEIEVVTKDKRGRTIKFGRKSKSVLPLAAW